MPFTPQPTNNTPETKTTVDTFNEIAENDIYLKERADKVDSDLGQAVNTDSSPNFQNITLTGMTGTVEGRIETNTSDIATNASKLNQDVKTTSSPTFAGLTLNGAFLPETTPTETSHSIADGATYTIPRGIFYISATKTGTIGFIILEKYIDGAWGAVATKSSSLANELLGGLQSSTGATSGTGALRVRVTGTSTASIVVQKS